MVVDGKGIIHGTFRNFCVEKNTAGDQNFGGLAQRLRQKLRETHGWHGWLVPKALVSHQGDPGAIPGQGHNVS